MRLVLNPAAMGKNDNFLLFFILFIIVRIYGAIQNFNSNMGRIPNVPQKEVIELIEKHIHRLATNDFPPYGDTLWKTMSKDLDGRWLPRSVYTHVRYDKRGDLTQAQRNQGICTSPETKPYLIEDKIDEIESDHEELCTSEPDDDYVPEDIRNENLQECDSFDLLLTSEEWSLIKPDESKSKNRLKTETWPSVITRAFWKRGCHAFLQMLLEVAPAAVAYDSRDQRTILQNAKEVATAN